MSLFACSILLHIKDPKETTRNPILLINTLNKVEEDKINTKSSILPITKKYTEQEIRKTFPFSIASKSILE